MGKIQKPAALDEIWQVVDPVATWFSSLLAPGQLKTGETSFFFGLVGGQGGLNAHP